MRLIRNSLFVILTYIVFNSSGYSQGCSDAGFCTIDLLKDHSMPGSEDNLKNTLKAGLTYGVGDFSINVISPYLEYGNNISENLSLSAKVTFAATSGELNSNSNFSDIFLTSSYQLKKSSTYNIALVSGVKIPLSTSNIKDGDQPLPMNYQSSLGTFDFILGLNLLYKDLGISIAMQQPVVNINENTFFSSDGVNSPQAKYHSTNSFIRKGDILNRVSYNLTVLIDKFSIRPSILSIYHLADDSFTDQNDIEQEIDGSAGLTLNGNIFLIYNISGTKSIELVVGSPFITRESRPDGLTREFVLGLEYKMLF
ncbi:MAG: hypothetical protein JSV22_14700 [Bacteroidales bacterium]|nr:MAG: hypothetical protein JSV22_14700 [Bacteroidales bacterium]